MMSLRKNPYGPVWGASGVQGFFGEGYPFHKIFRLVPGFSFEGMTFVAKTATISPRQGNMPLKGIRPTERRPRCIYVDSSKGIALNAVGLSNPGFEALFNFRDREFRWQGRTTPFQLSFMSLEPTPEARQREWKKFINLASWHLPDLWTSNIGIQKNESCPNVGMDHSHIDELIDEIISNLDLARSLGVRCRLIIKLAANFPPQKVMAIAEHTLCWGLCVSNAIPWRAEIPWLPKDDQIDWDSLFGKGSISPLKLRGFKQDGGLSGRPLLPIVCEWIRLARQHGVRCHINGGGGILSPEDVDSYADAGADSVFLGSIAFLRPWRVQKCIRRAHERLSKSSSPV